VSAKAHGRDILPGEIAVANQSIPVSETLKVLGVIFDKNLQWKTQASSLVTRAQRMISGLKVIRSKLTQDQFMKIVTSQYFGALYYGIPVWYDALQKKDKLKMDTLHYKVLRVAVKDWSLMSKDV